MPAVCCSPRYNVSPARDSDAPDLSKASIVVDLIPVHELSQIDLLQTQFECENCDAVPVPMLELLQVLSSAGDCISCPNALSCCRTFSAHDLLQTLNPAVRPSASRAFARPLSADLNAYSRTLKKNPETSSNSQKSFYYATCLRS